MSKTPCRTGSVGLGQVSLTQAPSSFLTCTPSMDLGTTQSQPFALSYPPVPFHVAVAPEPAEISVAELVFNVLFLPQYSSFMLHQRGDGSSPFSVGGA